MFKKKKNSTCIYHVLFITTFAIKHVFIRQTDEKLLPFHQRGVNNNLFMKKLLHTQRHNKKSTRFDSDSFPICLDTGALSTATSDKNDFIPGSCTPLKVVSISGISSSLQATDHGAVKWEFIDDKV